MGESFSRPRRNFLRTLVAGGLVFGIGRSLAQSLPAKKSRPFRVLFYTDVHALDSMNAPLAIARATEVINSQTVDIIVNGGDLIHGGFRSTREVAESRWDIYMSMHNTIKGSVFPCLGNHDLVGVKPVGESTPTEDPRAMFKRRLGLDRTYYSFDALGHHFLVLDSVHTNGGADGYGGYIEPEQLAWISEDLSKVAHHTPVIVVTHIPLLTAFYAATEGATKPTPAKFVIANNVEVLDAFRRHNLVLVLQGHLHLNELIRWRNTTFITGGAICGRWWQGPRHGTEEGFGIVTLDNNKVAWEYIDYGWEAGGRH